MQNDGWVKPFLTLDLCGGTLVSILNEVSCLLEQSIALRYNQFTK